MANTSGYIDLAQDFARWGRQLPGVTKLEDALGPLLDDIAAAADDVARYWK
jgi:hypothetical protein